MTSYILEKAYISNQVIFSTWTKSQDKNSNILRTKRAFMMKIKAFFIIFKGLSLKQIKQIFGDWESGLNQNFSPI